MVRDGNAAARRDGKVYNRASVKSTRRCCSASARQTGAEGPRRTEAARRGEPRTSDWLNAVDSWVDHGRRLRHAASRARAAAAAREPCSPDTCSMARRCASRAGNQRAASSYATLAPAPSASARPGSTGGDRFRPPTAGCRRRARLAVWRGIVTRRCWAWAARWAAASVVVYNGCARPLQVKLGAQAGDAAGAARHFTRDI